MHAGVTDPDDQVDESIGVQVSTSELGADGTEGGGDDRRAKAACSVSQHALDHGLASPHQIAPAISIDIVETPCPLGGNGKFGQYSEGPSHPDENLETVVVLNEEIDLSIPSQEPKLTPKRWP